MMHCGRGFSAETGKETTDSITAESERPAMRSPMSRVQFIRGTAVQMMGSYIVLILFAFLVEGVFGDKDEVMSVMKGNRVTLNTGDTKNPGDVFLWYFEETRIALVNGHPKDSCLYYGEDEIFKDRLGMDHKTGSLTITTSRPEHTGRYQAEFFKHGNTSKIEMFNRTTQKCDHRKIYKKGSDVVIHKSFNLTVRAVPDSGPSPGAVPGIVVAVLLLVAAAVGVMIYRRRSSRNYIKKKVPDQVSDEKLMA